MQIEIKPLIGVGKTEFGMSQAEVEKLLGEAARIEIDNVMQETREQRQGMTFRYIGDELKDVIISQYVEAFVFGLPIYTTADLIEQLSEHDTPTAEKSGYINFYRLGLSLGGFGSKKIKEGRLVTAFSADRIQFYKYFLEV